jgi:hypothetical protein
MRHFFSLAALFLSLLSFPSVVRADDGVFYHHTGEHSYKKKFIRDSDSHGYSPRTFSSHRMGPYSHTPEEAGHYILGESSERRRYDYRPAVTYIQDVEALDPTRVLVSAPARQVLIEATVLFKPQPLENRPARINDSLDLQRVIEEHRWVLPKFLLNQL